MVVHGPPGTGKSQTIANLIADALAENKTVLFVSAKMAALNVVHARLSRLGLERFCLEAHSTKAGKTRIIDELKKTLGAAQEVATDRLGEEIPDLLRLREELNTYVREIHGRRPPLGLTIYEAIGRSEKLRTEADLRAPIPWSDAASVSRSDLNSVLEALAELGAQGEVFDRRTSHPWRGFAVKPGRSIRREAIETDLATIRAAVQKLQSSIAGLGSLLDIDPEHVSLHTTACLAPALRELGDVDWLPNDWATRGLGELRSAASLLSTAAASAKELLSKRAEYQAILKIPVRQAGALLTPVLSQFRRPTRVLQPSYWRWRASVRSSLREGVPANLSTLRTYLALATRIVDLEQWFDEHREALSPEIDGREVVEPEKLATAANRLRVAVEFRTALETCGLRTPTTSPPLKEAVRAHVKALVQAATASALEKAIEQIDHAWSGGFIEDLALTHTPLPALLARCEEVLAAIPKMHEWVALQHALLRCHDLGLSAFIDCLGTLSAKAAKGAFERRFLSLWTNAAFDNTPALAIFSGARREDQIERYRSLDAKTQQSALARARANASAPARRVATAQPGAGNVSEIGILRRELEKRRKIKPMRKLFAEIPGVLQALKPCLLMSPLSVSTFLKPGAMSFDLVVFDEASQLPAYEAIPAILRAKQVVVAGDRNQLPPTSFFGTSVIFDDGEEDRLEDLEPLESLLDDCVAVYPVFEEAHLRWHYRSKDERLIKFSNHYFYRDTPLITFPSARFSEDQGIRLIHVPEGLWDRGASRTNRAEARRVAALVVEQLEQHPQRSIGVVAMNVTQREAIEESLEELMQYRPDLTPLLDRTRTEAVFIKSLENVQGDERDTIIISVGYGRGPTGAVGLNFGPLNQEGGWRRLNVLVTRARWQTILVTSMRSHELDALNPNNRGAVALRNFIAYAERDSELPADPTVLTGAETNDFEDAVAEGLRERGLQIDEQVGASEYRIDLAIRDPRDATRYVLGIECDGATYHSARTARDRDLLRQEVLREQGWRLHRIWSADWFRDRDKSITGVLRALEKALVAPLEASVPAPHILNSEALPPQETPQTAVVGSLLGNAASTARRYPPGTPYERFRHSGQREILLDRSLLQHLAAQVAKTVDFEGPIHRDLLVERLKEINGVSRAGNNVQTNIDRAIDNAIQRGGIECTDRDFFVRRGVAPERFRTPGDDITRPLTMISPQEIALAVLHIVEDQFGYQRHALPRVIAERFGFERTPVGSTELVGTVVDDLVERGLLKASGPNVTLA